MYKILFIALLGLTAANALTFYETKPNFARVTESTKSGDLLREAKITTTKESFEESMKDSLDEKHTLHFEFENGSLDVTIEKTGAKSGTLSFVPSKEFTLTKNDAAFMKKVSESESSTYLSTHNRAGLLSRVALWLSRIPVDHKVLSKTMDVKINNVLPSARVVPEGEESGIRVAGQVSCPGLCYGNSPCPMYTGTDYDSTVCPFKYNHGYGDDGATCMCPYHGTTPTYAFYSYRTGEEWAWSLKYGSAQDCCLGRCGAGCNWLDKEAFLDCFDHDVCLTHFDGSVLGSNPDCGDEFDDAADDYIVSYGWGCC